MKRICVTACNDQLIATHALIMFLGFSIGVMVGFLVWGVLVP